MICQFDSFGIVCQFLSLGPVCQFYSFRPPGLSVLLIFSSLPFDRTLQSKILECPINVLVCSEMVFEHQNNFLLLSWKSNWSNWKMACLESKSSKTTPCTNLQPLIKIQWFHQDLKLDSLQNKGEHNQSKTNTVNVNLCTWIFVFPKERPACV